MKIYGIAKAIPWYEPDSRHVFDCASDFQTASYYFRRQARHTDDFIPAGLAGCNGNGGTRQVQKFCEKINAGFVGFAVDGRGCEGQFYCVAYFAGDGILLCAGVDFDREGCSAGRVFYLCRRKALPWGRRGTQGNSNNWGCRVVRIQKFVGVPPPYPK